MNLTTKKERHCIKQLVMWCSGILSGGIRFCIFKPALFHCSNMRIAVVVENSGGYAKMAYNVLPLYAVQITDRANHKNRSKVLFDF